MTDQLDLDGLEGLARAATPLVWTAEWTDLDYNGLGPEGWCVDSLAGAVCVPDGPLGQREWDAKFIAAANPAVVLSLITRLRASEAATAAAVEALEAGDLWWDPNDPEEGHNSMEDAFGHATQWDCDGPVELSRARSLPNVWALKINIDTTGDGEADDYEIRLFATLAEAEAVQAEIEADLPTPSSGGE